jgi:hypothetical protein
MEVNQNEKEAFVTFAWGIAHFQPLRLCYEDVTGR